jgi:hypothetical protein
MKFAINIENRIQPKLYCITLFVKTLEINEKKILWENISSTRKTGKSIEK